MNPVTSGVVPLVVKLLQVTCMARPRGGLSSNLSLVGEVFKMFGTTPLLEKFTFQKKKPDVNSDHNDESNSSRAMTDIIRRAAQVHFSKPGVSRNAEYMTSLFEITAFQVMV